MLSAQSDKTSGMHWGAGYGCRRDYVIDLNVDYTVKRWFCRGEVSTLYGPSNVGKTALLCHLGHCITTGIPFFGARIRRGIFVHVGAEAPDSIQSRAKSYPVSPDELPYLVKDQAVDLSDATAVKTFIQALEAMMTASGLPIAMVVIDTLARSIGTTEENCATAMGRIAEAATRIAKAVPTHVMLVHHSGKDLERGARGSTALRGAVDTEIRLRAEEDGAVVVEQEKQRNMERADSVRFRLDAIIIGQDSDGDDRTIVRVVELDGNPAPKPARARKGRARELETALQTVLHNRRRSLNPAHHAFTTSDILEALPETVFTTPVRESRLKAIGRALAGLAKQKHPAVAGGDGKWRVLSPPEEVRAQEVA